MKPHVEQLECRILSAVLTDHMATTRPDPQTPHEVDVAYWLARDDMTGAHLVSVAVVGPAGYDQHFVELPMIPASVDNAHTAVAIGPANVGVVTWRVGPQVWQMSVDSLGPVDLPHLVIDVSAVPPPIAGASFVAALSQQVLTVSAGGIDMPAYVLDRAFADPTALMVIVPVDLGDAGQWVLTAKTHDAGATLDQPAWMRLDEFMTEWQSP